MGISSKDYHKGNPKWVREERGRYRWEYRLKNQYWSYGYYKTAQEAHEACLKHKATNNPTSMDKEHFKKIIEQEIQRLTDIRNERHYQYETEHIRLQGVIDGLNAAMYLIDESENT